MLSIAILVSFLSAGLDSILAGLPAPKGCKNAYSIKDDYLAAYVTLLLNLYPSDDLDQGFPKLRKTHLFKELRRRRCSVRFLSLQRLHLAERILTFRLLSGALGHPAFVR